MGDLGRTRPKEERRAKRGRVSWQPARGARIVERRDEAQTHGNTQIIRSSEPFRGNDGGTDLGKVRTRRRREKSELLDWR